MSWPADRSNIWKHYVYVHTCWLRWLIWRRLSSLTHTMCWLIMITYYRLIEAPRTQSEGMYECRVAKAGKHSGVPVLVRMCQTWSEECEGAIGWLSQLPICHLVRLPINASVVPAPHHVSQTLTLIAPRASKEREPHQDYTIIIRTWRLLEPMGPATKFMLCVCLGIQWFNLAESMRTGSSWQSPS